MFSGLVDVKEVKEYGKQIGAKHIVYGITYKDIAGDLKIQWDEASELSNIFFDDDSFNEWVNYIQKQYELYGLTDIMFYAVHFN